MYGVVFVLVDFGFFVIDFCYYVVYVYVFGDVVVVVVMGGGDVVVVVQVCYYVGGGGFFVGVEVDEVGYFVCGEFDVQVFFEGVDGVYYVVGMEQLVGVQSGYFVVFQVVFMGLLGFVGWLVGDGGWCR